MTILIEDVAVFIFYLTGSRIQLLLRSLQESVPL